jgi:hypothetical protein
VTAAWQSDLYVFVAGQPWMAITGPTRFGHRTGFQAALIELAKKSAAVTQRGQRKCASVWLFVRLGQHRHSTFRLQISEIRQCWQKFFWVGHNGTHRRRPIGQNGILTPFIFQAIGGW